MRALVIGKSGQLARALVRRVPSGASAVSLGRKLVNLFDREAVVEAVKAASPDLVFNAAAYTEVDRAESEPEAARALNATAVGHLAKAAEAAGAMLVQVSTDYVFDGFSNRPYAPDAPTNPLNVYGLTKLQGEADAGPESLIVRTSWLYSTGERNFPATILNLLGRNQELRVVADQIGAPTAVDGLADTLWKLAGSGANGIFHFTDSGVASWYDFAIAVRQCALDVNPTLELGAVLPIASEDYPTAAQRPRFSLLDTRATIAAVGETPAHWRENLRRVLWEKLHG